MEITRRKEDGAFGVWFDPLLKAASACDKFFNCAYVKKQLEEEWKQEIRCEESAVDRVWMRLEKGVEVDLYRQFLFQENAVMHSVDDKVAGITTRGLMGKDDTEPVPALRRTDS